MTKEVHETERKRRKDATLNDLAEAEESRGERRKEEVEGRLGSEVGAMLAESRGGGEGGREGSRGKGSRGRGIGRRAITKRNDTHLLDPERTPKFGQRGSHGAENGAMNSGGSIEGGGFRRGRREGRRKGEHSHVKEGAVRGRGGTLGGRGGYHHCQNGMSTNTVHAISNKDKSDSTQMHMPHTGNTQNTQVCPHCANSMIPGEATQDHITNHIYVTEDHVPNQMNAAIEQVNNEGTNQMASVNHMTNQMAQTLDHLTVADIHRNRLRDSNSDIWSSFSSGVSTMRTSCASRCSMSSGISSVSKTMPMGSILEANSPTNTPSPLARWHGGNVGARHGAWRAIRGGRRGGSKGCKCNESSDNNNTFDFDTRNMELSAICLQDGKPAIDTAGMECVKSRTIPPSIEIVCGHHASVNPQVSATQPPFSEYHMNFHDHNGLISEERRKNTDIEMSEFPQRNGLMIAKGVT